MQDAIAELKTGSGDMLKSVYDVNDNSIVDDADKVNGHTVQSDVPANASFTDNQDLYMSGNTIYLYREYCFRDFAGGSNRRGYDHVGLRYQFK